MEILYKIINYLIVLFLLSYSFYILYGFLKTRDDLEMLKLSERDRKSKFYKKANQIMSVNLKKKTEFIDSLSDLEYEQLKKDFYIALDPKKHIELRKKESILSQINKLELNLIKNKKECNLC